MRSQLTIKSLLGMKVVLIGLMVTAVAGGLIGGGLFAYFSDVETGTHNTFTAGTIDIAVDGENPWNSSCTVSYPAGCEPGSEGCLTDFKPSEWGEIEFTISNVGTNTVDLQKRIYGTEYPGGSADYYCGEIEGWEVWVSSDSECIAEGTVWDPEPQTWNASGWDNVDDIQDYMTYDIDSPGCYIGPEEGVGFMEVGGWETGYPLPWQEPPIEDEQDCLALHDHSGSILGNRQEATDWVSMIMARSASCGVADVPGAASPLVGWALLGEAFLAV